MEQQARIAVFAGSARKGSVNRKLALVAARHARELGACVSVIELAEHRLAIYDGDDEAGSGVPETARRLRNLLVGQDGLIIASPEYNSSISPLLKNSIDWISRPDGDTPGLVAFRGKVAGLVSAAPGGLGGLRGLVHLRAILGNIGVIVVPQQHAVSNAGTAFDEAGNLVRDADDRAVRAVADAVTSLARCRLTR